MRRFFAATVSLVLAGLFCPLVAYAQRPTVLPPKTTTKPATRPATKAPIQRSAKLDTADTGIDPMSGYIDSTGAIDSVGLVNSGNQGLQLLPYHDITDTPSVVSGIPRPAPPPAQDVICAPTVPRQSPVPLQLFGGATYTLVSAASADTTDAGALGDLGSITLPNVIGVQNASMPGVLPSGLPTSWNGYTADERNHTNMLWLGVLPVTVHWNQNLSVAKNKLSDLLRTAGTVGFCVSKNMSDGFYLRLGVQQDLRWQSNGFLAGTAGSLFGTEWSTRDYIGTHVYPWIRQGVGFPVQWYSIAPPSQWNNPSQMTSWNAQGDRLADALFAANSGSQKQAMAFSTYEFELFGSIDSAYAITLPKQCTKEGGVGGLFGGKKCVGPKQSIAIARSLVGEVRRRNYRDPRIGLPTDSSQSAEVRMTIRMTAPVWSSYTDADVNAMVAMVHQMCQGASACGIAKFPPAEGMVEIPGSDDSVRAAAMCQQAAGHDCLGESTPEAKAANASQPQIDSATNGVPSAHDMTIGMPTAISVLDGNAGTMRMGPLMSERRCLEQAQLDSAAYVTGPIPVGQARTAPPSAAALASACMATATAADTLGGGGSGSEAVQGGYSAGGGQGQAMQQAARVSSPSGSSSSPTPKTATGAQPITPAPACQTVNGRRYCVQVAPPKPPASGRKP